MRIFKYTLAVVDEQTVTLPAMAQILSVQIQGGMPQLWAYVNEHNAPEPRTIRIIGTGHPIDSFPGDFIGTIQMEGGALVFHVFAK